MYRTLVGILAVFAAALLLAGFTFSRSTTAPADFRFVNGTEPKTLDPHLANGEPEGRLIWELFEGLTRLEPKTLKSVPGVAESWEISPDGTRYVFRIRPNARWSDGSPVTANDFAYSWRRLLTPALGSEYSYLLGPIRLATELSTFDGLADAIQSKIRPSFAALRKSSPAAVPSQAWQKFLAETHAHDALQHSADKLVVNLLSRREGTVGAAELDAFGRALSELEQKLRAGAAHARAHFGVDQGAFAPDPRTFVVELKAATPYFLEITSFYPAAPVKRSLVEDPKLRGAWFLAENIVGNGPYRLRSWLVNDRIRLEKSETYWDKSRVRLESIEAVAMESETTALNLYLTGAVDWLPKIFPKDLADVVRKHPDFYSKPGLVVYFYRLNTTRKPLNDRRVREALNLAIDREVIANEVLALGQLPAYTLVPPGLPGYTPPETGISRNVGRARALLAEAGYPGGKGFPKIGILYNTNEGHKKIAEVLADQLRKNLGIEIAAYNQEWQSYQETTRALDYDISRTGWIGDYNDPNTFLDLWVTNGPNNQTGFGSARYDRLIRLAADVTPFVNEPEPLLSDLRDRDAIRATVEAVRSGPPEARLAARDKLRLQLFREAEGILVREEFPIIPIYFYVNSGFIRPYVRGFYMTLEMPDGSTAVNPKAVHPLSGIWIDKQVER